MINDEIKYSKDGNCPYCNSVNVTFTGMSISDARASSTGRYPEARHKIWKCKDCKKRFFFEGEF